MRRHPTRRVPPHPACTTPPSPSLRLAEGDSCLLCQLKMIKLWGETAFTGIALIFPLPSGEGKWGSLGSMKRGLFLILVLSETQSAFHRMFAEFPAQLIDGALGFCECLEFCVERHRFGYGLAQM